MTTGKKHIGELHADHQSVKSEASLYKCELKIFRERLQEVAAKNTKPDVTAQVEHFQNQLLLQQEQLDILTHEINVHESALAHYAADHTVAVDHRLFDNHNDMLEKAAMFRKLYSGFKTEFNRFLSTVL